MTRQRNDEHSTEFGLWLRNQKEIDSELGFTTTNVDYVWYNYKRGLWMYLEEKRFGAWPSWSQRQTFWRLHGSISPYEQQKYRGFHFLVFGATNPDDGAIYLNQKEIDRDVLIRFLRFDLPPEQYDTNEFLFTARGLTDTEEAHMNSYAINGR